MTGASLGRPAAGGILYVVATPIGNLGDVTLRALEVLRAVPLIAAEDTRISRRLLVRYEIATRTVSFHARSGPARLAELVAHLRGGADLALVTDAGTPAVSDPGGDLVAAWAAEGGRVLPIPGASAVLAAVAASGIAGPRWGFEGFLPRSGRERRERLARIAADDRATVLYEAPTRLAATLRDLAAACGDERAAAVCRELTKLHEQIARGTLAELSASVAAGEIPSRGEIALVIAGRGPGSLGPQEAIGAVGGTTLAEARERVSHLAATGLRRADAARQVATETGFSRRDLYES
ncbi:MAG TPA: 16S rRNA (cytidine(1402)-2'-O)-methyltransferase [Candidatus Limnocylindria bacterium]|nr:16S rRNA (cytidine(1402)-2'-O)-methyltransferase [Candidatus Limnocylindria bacterium]